MTDPAAHLAENLRALRHARGLTQQKLAAAAGVPRPTVATLESGASNPTLAVMVKLAAALRVPIEELIAAPRGAAELVRAADIPETVRTGVKIRALLPEHVPGLVVERLELPPGKQMRGEPHTPGTREYLVCEQGELELWASGERYTLGAGDVVAFRGDQKHAYRNPGRKTAIGFSVIALRPG